MNREQAEELWRQRFDEYGLSERFELVGRDWTSPKGVKASVRCKACGAVFETWNIKALFQGKVKALTCPRCGIRSNGQVMLNKTTRADEIVKHYENGHSAKATAKCFNLEEYQVQNIIYGRGGRRREKLPPNPIGLSSGNKAQAERARTKIMATINATGFMYAGGYSDTKGKVTIKCIECGCEFERTVAFVRKGQIKCPECEKQKRLIRITKAKQRKTEQRKEREAERKAKNPDGFSYYQLSIRYKLDVVHVCEVCGDEYTLRQRMENEGLKYCRDSGCCSKRCGKKKAAKKERAKGIKTIRHRVKKYGCEFDSSVSLKKLICRDGLRCAICGEMCNPNDHEWTEYFGPMSPTIDHIKPLSKGGSHTWDNVQVAHAICNSTKRDYYEAG